MDSSITTGAPERDARGRWAPGQSGNAAGKAPGTRNRGTVLREQLGAATEDALSRSVRNVVEKLEQGSYSAACFLLNGLAPNARGRAIALDLPPDAEPDAIMDAIMRDTLAGEITLDEAMGYVRLLKEQLAIRQLCAARRRSADAIPEMGAPLPTDGPAGSAPSARPARSTRSGAPPRRRDTPPAGAAPDAAPPPAFHLQKQAAGPVRRTDRPDAIAAVAAAIAVGRPPAPDAASPRGLRAGVALPRPPGPPLVTRAPDAGARGPAGLPRAA